MAVYIVGDIQGCYEPLIRGLDAINFDPAKDTLFCSGDLVNRGKDSLKTIKLIKSIKNQCFTVIGNHDIHLLMCLYGVIQPRSNDTLNDILESQYADSFAEWLRSQALMIKNNEYRFILTHAGLYPEWSIHQAQQYATEVELVLQNKKQCLNLLQGLYHNTPSKWNNNLRHTERYRFIINAFTRMRFVNSKNELNFSDKNYANKNEKKAIPWFKARKKSFLVNEDSYKVIFGHWSSLGFYNKAHYLCLDTGCVWGKKMTFVELKQQPTELKKIKKSKIHFIPA